MAVTFLEGFDHYQQWANVIPPKWTGSWPNAGSNVGVASWLGNGRGNGCVIADSNGKGMYRALASNQATLTIGAAVYFPSAGSPINIGAPSVISGSNAGPGTGPILGILDGTTEQLSVRSDGSGHFRVTRNGTTLATSANSFSLDTWHYVELKATIHPSAGVIELHVNGATWIASTGSLNTRNTANSYANGIGICNPNNLQVVFDDIYACDNTGSVNTGFLGPITVGVVLPVGAGAHTDWTPNGSTNFGSVNDVPTPDGDVTFNQSSTPNQIDTFQMSVLPEASGSIFAVQHCIYARQDAGAARTFAPLIRDGAGPTDYPGTTVALGSSYQEFLEIHETDPDTGAAWTLAGLTAAQFGYKEIS
jgi:hypothetical protein